MNKKSNLLKISSGKVISSENIYDRLVYEAMYNWGKYSKIYRTLLDEYNKLIEEKRELNLKLNTINKKELEQYPENKFLSIEEEEKAREYVESMTPNEIKATIRDVESMVNTNYVFRTVRSKVSDFKKQIEKARNKTDSTYKRPIVGKI